MRRTGTCVSLARNMWCRPEAELRIEVQPVTLSPSSSPSGRELPYFLGQCIVPT
jgi:hypothetical protein